MILINAHNLSKAFASKTLFAGVSFGIDEGERVGLVGPNGAGKSTLLKIIAGQMAPDQGQVSPKRGLRLGYLEQTPQFSSDETIIQALLSRTDHPDDAYAEAFAWLGQLELAQFGENFPVQQLSGGWQKRVALARELMREPELLLLDEPTNHLDVSSILWLEEFLRQARFSTLMVTHDRLFLQRVVTRVMDLDPRNSNQLLVVNGGYDKYLEAKELELAASARHETVKRNTLRRETEWLRRGSIARQTKQQARIDAAHNLKDEVAQLESRNRHRQVKIEFGEAENAPQKLIEAKSISMQFGEKTLFSQLNVLLRRQSRLAILGDNGIGKSTLIKVLLGEILPTKGVVQRAESLQVAYFEQNRETLNPNLSVLKNICPEGDYVSYRGQHVHVRSYLDRFLFFGHQAELPVHRLSGGEQARLRLAQVMLSDAQVLVLDEPTNDLDADTLDVLENSLSEFPGALILVTHDRYFMDALADEILAFPPLGFPGRELVKFSDYWQWEKWFRALRPEARAKGPSESAPIPTATSASRRVKLSFKEQFELDHIEEEILKLEQRQQELQTESQLPEVLTDRQRLQELMTELSNVSMQIENKYERWELLSAKSAGKI